MSDQQPEWWCRALQLERQDRLDEAEKAITLGMPADAPVCRQLAELYARRLERLLSAGQWDAAQQAYDMAVMWIDRNSAGATSGGEGLALERLADTFKRKLTHPQRARAQAAK